MLEPHHLVLDLIFSAKAEMDSETFVSAFGGEDALKTYTILDPDTQDPRLEMELSPSYPFRKQHERRLLVIDNDFGALKQNENELLVSKDLRTKKKQLLDLCKALPLRFARLFSLGTWGDAVWISKNAKDFRGIALMSWALDPQTDVDGKKRETPLNQNEFETKLQAYEKRIDELDEKAILGNCGPASITRDGEHIVIDVLDNDGHWNLGDSSRLEQSMAALESFSMIAGAPSSGKPSSKEESKTTPPSSKEKSNPPLESKQNLTPIEFKEIDGNVLLVIPESRFDLDFAAKLGKKDWETVLGYLPSISGVQKDLVYRQGLDFLTAIDFFSEVILDGVPLDKKSFLEKANEHSSGIKTMQVRFPRYGEVQLLQNSKNQKWITSNTSSFDSKPSEWLQLIS